MLMCLFHIIVFEGDGFNARNVLFFGEGRDACFCERPFDSPIPDSPIPDSQPAEVSVCSMMRVKNTAVPGTAGWVPCSRWFIGVRWPFTPHVVLLSGVN